MKEIFKDWSPTSPGGYRYRIKSLKHNSAKYGPCEVCGDHVSEVFYQVEEKEYLINGKSGFTQHECKSLFGHEGCLLQKRR